MLFNIRRALAERLRVTNHLPDIFGLCARHHQQILHNFRFVHAGDIQRTEKGQIHHLAHVAVKTIFHRQQSAITIPINHCLISRLEICARHTRGIRKDALRYNVRKGTFYPAIRHTHTVQQTVLQVFGQINIGAQKIDVIRAISLILHTRAVALYHLFLTGKVIHRHPVFLFVRRYQPHGIHALLKQARHFFVYFIDLLSRFI